MHLIPWIREIYVFLEHNRIFMTSHILGSDHCHTHLKIRWILYFYAQKETFYCYYYSESLYLLLDGLLTFICSGGREERDYLGNVWWWWVYPLSWWPLRHLCQSGWNCTLKQVQFLVCLLHLNRAVFIFKFIYLYIFYCF